MQVTDEMMQAFSVSMFCHGNTEKALQAALDAMPKQDPVCYVYHPSERLIDWNTELFSFSFELPEEGTPLYTNPQPPHEPMSVTRHEVETAMMLCEINFCENPSEYIYWLLDKLEIGVEK